MPAQAPVPHCMVQQMSKQQDTKLFCGLLQITSLALRADRQPVVVLAGFTLTSTTLSRSLGPPSGQWGNPMTPGRPVPRAKWLSTW